MTTRACLRGSTVTVMRRAQGLTAVVGDNGAGKSTLLDVLAAVLVMGAR